jgi:hypothetical protein
VIQLGEKASTHAVRPFATDTLNRKGKSKAVEQDVVHPASSSSQGEGTSNMGQKASQTSTLPPKMPDTILYPKTIQPGSDSLQPSPGAAGLGEETTPPSTVTSATKEEKTGKLADISPTFNAATAFSNGEPEPQAQVSGPKYSSDPPSMSSPSPSSSTATATSGDDKEEPTITGRQGDIIDTEDDEVGISPLYRDDAEYPVSALCPVAGIKSPFISNRTAVSLWMYVRDTLKLSCTHIAQLWQLLYP